MHTATPIVTAVLLAASLAAQNFHFEFDDSALPHATVGVAQLVTAASASFVAGCGRLQQNTTLGAGTLAIFYNGTVSGLPPTPPTWTPNVPVWAEASFRVLSATGTYSNVLSIYQNNRQTSLLVDCTTMKVGLHTIAGIAWTSPGIASGAHTYRLDTIMLGSSVQSRLWIDNVLTLSGFGPSTTSRGFAFGDLGGNTNSLAIEWDHVSIGQSTPGPGQANSDAAALFVNRSTTTATGMPGLRGPFASTAPGGTTLTLEWNGPANMPYALFAGPQSPQFFDFGCGGLADVAQPWTVLFDPFAPFSGLLFWLDGCGYAKQTIVVPPIPGNTPLINLQGVVFQPAGCPFVLTAAHFVNG